VLNIISVGGGALAERIKPIWSNPSFFKEEPGSFRKLSWFPDREDKVRVIAILDFWSQTALRPLHSFLFSVLRRIPQDRTFNQGNFKDTLGDANIFYSID